MSRVYFIQDAEGERRSDEGDLPFSIGGSDQHDIVLPDVPSGVTVAHIAVAEGHAYIQPADTSTPMYHNHEHFSDSRWLKSGDLVQVGEAAIHWTVKGDQVFIQVQRRAAEVPAIPPKDPPPDSAGTRSSLPVKDSSPPPHAHHKLRRITALLFTLLVLVVAFVLLATPVAVTINPEPSERSVSGFPPVVPLAGRLLVLPGRYTVRASMEGYYPLEESLNVPMGGFQEYSFQMVELPGRVSIHVAPAVAFELFVDEVPVNTDAAAIADIMRGVHNLRVETERYLPEQRQLDVAGLGKAQTVEFALRPAWADVHIESRPTGAEVRVDDDVVGTTPLDTEILQGSREITLSLPMHKPVSLRKEIRAGSTLALEVIKLPPADGRLVLQSRPPGATISVDGKFLGTTPTNLTLSSRQAHRIRLSEPGYQVFEKEITLEPDQEQELAVTLSPQYGTVFVTAHPADASLLVDGQPAGKSSQRLRLTTRPHELEFRKTGYVVHRVTVTPRAGVSQNLEVTLKTTKQAEIEATPSTLTTAAGQLLHLVRPVEPFRMGASRREAGRRANESQRLVQLTRPFYLGDKEVTNDQFRRFRPAHRSGSAEGASLDGGEQPVVNVSWDDVARYCNWLSEKDGLPVAYQEKGGKMVPVMPATRGYRLPSEAEWAYVARVSGQGSPARYPWSGSFPPTSAVGNFADARISDTLADVVPGGYDDRYRGTAPVGSFSAHPAGFHDLGGNVAEWVQDYYAVYPGESERLVKDPVGPVSGEHHVVRGSSWRHGNITELRLSYRDYSRKARNDLGFRIARYAD